MRFKLILFLIVMFSLLYVPYLGTFLRITNTMIHETGHALAALAMKGEVVSVSLFANHEGVAQTLSPNWLSSLVIGLSGYIFSSVLAFLFCYLWIKKQPMLICITVFSFSLINLFLWVRNPFGLLWLVGCILLCVSVFYLRKEKWTKAVSLAFLSVLLVDSIRAAVDIVIISYYDPSHAGDSSMLANISFIPAMGWSVLFLIQALLFSFLAIRLLWKKPTV